MALLAIITLAGLSVAMVQIGASYNAETLAEVDDERALYLAEAAVAEAFFAVRNGATGNIGSQAAPARFGNGLFWSIATPIDANRTLVTIAAAVGKGRAALEATIAPVAHPAQRFALFSEEDMVINPSSVVDSFDSTLGSYEDQLDALGGDHVNDASIVATNGNIHVEMPSEIWGDAQPGPSKLATADDPSAISGSTTPSESTYTFETVTVPTFPSSGAFTNNAGPKTLASGDYHFTSMTTGVGAKTTIQGPARIVVDGTWQLKSNAKFIFDATTGPIEFFLAGSVDLASNSTIITTDLRAIGVTVYLVGGPTQSVEFDSNSSFYGTIYGPEAQVQIASNFEVFGAVAARHIELAANSNIHYDESLLNGSAGQLLTFEVQSWRQVEFPVPLMRVNRRDPFAVLGLDPAGLQGPGALNGI
jgi:hypothetical protein